MYQLKEGRMASWEERVIQFLVISSWWFSAAGLRLLAGVFW
jgi:hypothetical protein